jgi:hypothetical protein
LEDRTEEAGEIGDERRLELAEEAVEAGEDGMP